MKKYNVFIQNILTCAIEAKDTDDALRAIANKITEGEIVLDPEKPKEIRIEPINE